MKIVVKWKSTCTYSKEGNKQKKKKHREKDKEKSEAINSAESEVVLNTERKARR